MLTRGFPSIQVTKCKFNSNLKQETVFFDFSIASETRDFDMASRDRWYTTTGKGNVSTEEKVQYDEGVDVYFQSCAWMDSDINMQ